MEISILILTKDAGRYIRKSLESILSQKIDSQYEVICVDSGSRDNTEQICKENGVEFHKINPEQFNHGLTRNFAASLAKGDLLIFLSQDAIPVNVNWLRKLVGVLKSDDKIAGVYCCQIPRNSSSYLTRRQIENHLPKESQVCWIKQKVNYEKLTPVEKYRFCQFDNVCSCVRKSVWEKFKFNDVEFGEDIEWSKRVLEAGYKIAYCKEAAVVHSHTLSLKDTYRRAYIHHKILYNLFGFKVFPSFFSFFKNLIAFPLIIAANCIKEEKSSVHLFISLPRTALLSISSMLGQYFACFL
jgi:rhamnosyltransferase